MNKRPARIIAKTVHPASWKYDEITTSTIAITMNERTRVNPMRGQMLLCFSFISLGADSLMDPEFIPSPYRKGDMAAKVMATSRIFLSVPTQDGRRCFTAGAR